MHGDYRLRLVGTRGTAEIFWARGRVEVTTDDQPTRALDLPPGRRPAEEALDAFADGRTPRGRNPGFARRDPTRPPRPDLREQGGTALAWSRPAE